MKLLQIVTTFPDKEAVENAAEAILNEKLSACTQILGPTTSKYWWEGHIETANEYILFIKTTSTNFNKIKKIIKKVSSYELPEIIATEIVKGDKDYLDWLENQAIKQ